MKTDAEIFKRNVKRICKQKHMKLGSVSADNLKDYIIKGGEC